MTHHICHCDQRGPTAHPHHPLCALNLHIPLDLFGTWCPPRPVAAPPAAHDHRGQLARLLGRALDRARGAR